MKIKVLVKKMIALGVYVPIEAETKDQAAIVLQQILDDDSSILHDQLTEKFGNLRVTACYAVADEGGNVNADCDSDYRVVTDSYDYDLDLPAVVSEAEENTLMAHGVIV